MSSRAEEFHLRALPGRVEDRRGEGPNSGDRWWLPHKKRVFRGPRHDPEQVTRMRQVNVEGLSHATRSVIGGMRARRYGRIVNISSIAAIGTALPGNAFYAATKAEVAILTKRFAMELGPHNITVNAVAPGFVRTDMTPNNWQGTEEAFAAKAMMGRIGEPEDIATAVAFLASPEAGWITAQVLAVDGGRMDYIGHA